MKWHTQQDMAGWGGWEGMAMAVEKKLEYALCSYRFLSLRVTARPHIL